MSDKGLRFRFSEDFDLHLAREVYGQNPYEDPRRWGTIQINMLQITGRNVCVRTFRDRIQNLVKRHLAKSAELKGKSGIEMNQNEFEDLLQQISEIMSEFKKNKLSSSSYAEAKSSYLKGYDAREGACSNNTTDAPARKRSTVNARQSTVQYLEEKHEKLNEIRLREVALQEQKQLLEENKWEVEKLERHKRLELEERRLEMDEKRLNVELDLFSNQQELIKMLFTKKDNEMS